MSVVVPECLYHGSVSVFTRPDVRKGRGFKDFGKGFYMSVDVRQAVGMMHKKYAEASSIRGMIAIAEPHETLYRITLDAAVLEGLRVKVFVSADVEWLDFVLACRRTEAGKHDYDVQWFVSAQGVADRLIKTFESVDWRGI